MQTLVGELPSAVRPLGTFDLLKWHTEVVQGISTPYIYAAEAFTIFPAHVEHNLLPSINVNLGGPGNKNWIMIPFSQFEKVEGLLKKHKLSLGGRNIVMTAKNICVATKWSIQYSGKSQV